MKKFFADAYFFEAKNFLEKFFCNAYFQGRNSVRKNGFLGEVTF